MSNSQITVLAIDHVNQLLPDAAQAIEFYTSVYGVEIASDFREVFGPYNNLVFKLGSMTIEVFSPIGVEHSFDRQLTRFGPNWQAVLWRVPKLEAAIDICGERDIPLVDVEMEPDRRWAFTDPRVTSFSIQLEDRDDWDDSVASNALGVTHLEGFTAVVVDADASAEFFDSFVANSKILYREERPSISAQAVGLELGNYTMELLSPTGDGEIARFMARNRPRVRTSTFVVESLSALETHLASHGIHVQDGDRPGTVAVAPEDNLGVMMQFTE